MEDSADRRPHPTLSFACTSSTRDKTCRLNRSAFARAVDSTHVSYNKQLTGTNVEDALGAASLCDTPPTGNGESEPEGAHRDSMRQVIAVPLRRKPFFRWFVPRFPNRPNL